MTGATNSANGFKQHARASGHFFEGLDVAQMDLNDDELEFLIDALNRLHMDKKAALDTATKNNLGFTPRDFAIPQIAALLERVETTYNQS
jgi:hypothetical protein